VPQSIPAGEEVTVPEPVLLTPNLAAWVLAEISRETPSSRETRVKRAARLKRGAIDNARNVKKTSSLLSNRKTETRFDRIRRPTANLYDSSPAEIPLFFAPWLGSTIDTRYVHRCTNQLIPGRARKEN
jgi:hypothetical protein